MNASQQVRSDRHILLGVSHPSDDPARHRVFEVRASYSDDAGGWVAQIGEQNINEQFQGWGATLTDEGRVRVFNTPAACLGSAVEIIVAMVDAETESAPEAPN